MLFDTHAHYDSGAFNADRMEVLASMPEAGVPPIHRGPTNSKESEGQSAPRICPYP